MNSCLKFTIFLSISCLLACNADEILSYQEIKEAFNNPENNFFDVREKIELVETGKYPVATNIQSEYKEAITGFKTRAYYLLFLKNSF